MNLVINVCIAYPKALDNRRYQRVVSLPFAPYNGLTIRINGVDIELDNVRYDVEYGAFVAELYDESALEESRGGVHFYEAVQPLTKLYVEAGFVSCASEAA